MKNGVAKRIGAFCGILLLWGSVSCTTVAAEPMPETAVPETAVPEAVMPETVMPDSAAPEAQIPNPSAEQMPNSSAEQMDYETALLLNAQAEIAMQGIALQKYHVIDVLGDSLTEGVGARSADKAYPAVLSKLTGAVVNNYGLSCSRITDISGGVSNPASFIDRMYLMDKAADLVIVFGGTNDFWYGDCPIGSRTDTCVNTFYGALNTMIPYLKAAHANADIVFIVPYQQSKDADVNKPYVRSTNGNFGTGTLAQYRIAMLDRCAFYGVPVLDLYMDYELNTVDNRQALELYGNFLCDGCHLNDAGYNLLARKIYRFIMQDFTTYVPAYTEIHDMVFETAALPALVSGGNFILPNGEVMVSKPGFEVRPDMPLQQLYNHLVISAMY